MLAHFQDYAESLKPLLDEGFTNHLAHLLGNRRSFQSDGTKILTGGKRIKGAFLCLVTGTLGGTLEGAFHRAIAVELIQTATLIHDDFMDQHRLRRTVPALWTLDGTRRAVFLGDIIVASAIQTIFQVGIFREI